MFEVGVDQVDQVRKVRPGETLEERAAPVGPEFLGGQPIQRRVGKAGQVAVPAVAERLLLPLVPRDGRRIQAGGVVGRLSFDLALVIER